MSSGYLFGRGLRASTGYVRNLSLRDSMHGDVHYNTLKQARTQRFGRTSLCSCQYMQTRNKSAIVQPHSQSDSDSHTPTPTPTHKGTNTDTNTSTRGGIPSKYNDTRKTSTNITDNAAALDKTTRAFRTRTHNRQRNTKLRDRETAEEEAIERLADTQRKDNIVMRNRKSTKAPSNKNILSVLQHEFGNSPPEKVMPESQRLKYERQEEDKVMRKSVYQGVVMEGESGKSTGWENIEDGKCGVHIVIGSATYI
ncbi:hypothetical protein SARC_03480 [Sphaeroforma arctica JP610]|uniref:Uncharacterized protein n=1 Tax=Sphaeroforma arctica JP610 TaxID=667725 RepID=A0A0L0G5T9_9EUKA|nr:hypothetical protein SARC_03480 [Sphaeroforma arctica JP610]KNC84319.1 hypothetical protein SARC_03480 [Sphaeroforma arctica JP610]|eukprot:XP_014158221.1 hypothetical protein SARC_03480 [Sphaeroforma arctica JP610]